MKASKFKIALIVLLGVALSFNTVKAQLSSTEAGYLNAVTDYGADNTGTTVTTAQLQAAIDAAAAQKKALFLPAGTYLVDNTLECKNLAGDRENPVILIGSSIDPNNRSVILLKEGTFTNAGTPKTVIHNQGYSGYDSGFPDTFNRLLHSIDIRIQGNNPGAVALAWRGAEGCSLFDVHIDVTGGFAGINAILGSGGSTAKVSITGGQYGIYLASDNCQPTPTFTDITFSGQTMAAVYSNQTRGSLVFTGATFNMTNAVPVFNLGRHTGFTWSLGGNPVLTDCVIEYLSPDPANQVMVMTDGRDQSVFFMDVYVKNAAMILSEDATANGNPNGWRHYKKLAYNSGWDKSTEGDEPVYLEGVRSNEKLYEDYSDDVVPPANIQSKHAWGETFPSFETPGVVNVNSLSSLVANGDWAPAFNAAIEEAENNGSNVVFVPAGSYVIYNTIHLKAKTALIGCGHPVTQILGRDDASRRFGGSSNSWADTKPMIMTPDDKNASCILADLAVTVNGPYNAVTHSNEAMACYAILWKAGNNSVIRNINYMHELRTETNYRAAWALVGTNANGTGLQTKLINIRSIASPTTIQDMVFASESKMKWHTSPELPSRILVETVNANKRIMPRSMPPKELIGSLNGYEIPNMTITKADGGAFDITSLKITNAAWDPGLGDTVFIKGTGGNSTTKSIDLKNISRENLQTVALNWTGVTKVEITSNVPFSLDDVSINGSTIGFEDQTGALLAENTDWNHWLSGMPYMYLPMYYMAHEYVTIEGGCKWYNHWKHGSTWLNITKPYVMVQNNDPDDIVSFYHFHAQHSENFYKLKVVNAHNVSFFGAKTENALEFAHAQNSDNIRFFGHGGMTNPPVGTAHYRLENCTNWAVVSPTDEVADVSSCSGCGLGDAMLPKTAFGTYEVIHDLDDAVLTKTDKLHRPILYLRGNPKDPWGEACDTTFNVGVTNGVGSGNYCEGETVNISATIPKCKSFLNWTGDTAYLLNPFSANTSLTMPNDSVALTAIFEDRPYHTLTVTGGTGQGSYCEGEKIDIEAPKYLNNNVFDKWTGSGITWIDDVSNPIATVTMPESNIALTATYKPLAREYNGTPISIPGTIRLEEYDFGGEGIAYHDTDPNKWSVFRTSEEVDINEITPGGKDYFIGFIGSGEWIEYTTNVLSTDTFYIVVTYASGGVGGSFYIEVDGQKTGNSIEVGSTGGWKSFQTQTFYGYPLNEGKHIFRVFMENADYNLKQIEFKIPESTSLRVVSAACFLSICPNPVTENLRINTAYSSGFIQIKDVLGQLIMKQQVDSNSMLIDMSELESGFYLVQYELNSSCKCNFIVRQKQNTLNLPLTFCNKDIQHLENVAFIFVIEFTQLHDTFKSSFGINFTEISPRIQKIPIFVQSLTPWIAATTTKASTTLHTRPTPPPARSCPKGASCVQARAGIGSITCATT